MADRLSSIETLPLHLSADVRWLYDTILSRRMTQLSMMAEFNKRLAAAGEGLCSQSGFNRYVLKVRGGSVRRPTVGEPSASAAHDVFSPPFRTALVSAIGEAATKAQEAALAALIARLSRSEMEAA